MRSATSTSPATTVWANRTRWQNAICLHEEDYGLLWKHVNWRTNYTEARRSRRLVISFIATVGNYEYGFYWYFYQDGKLQFEVKLTGVISNGAAEPGETPKWGEMVAPQVYGPIHQHFFNVRLDMMVDGPNNSVYEVNTVSDPKGPDNPHHNAFHTEATLLETESQAQRIINPLSGRCWTIANPSSINRLGKPVSYKLMPGRKRAAVCRRRLECPQTRGVRHPAPVGNAVQTTRALRGGRLPEPASGWRRPAGVHPRRPARPIADTDVVVWYTFGAHHVVRPEDWPVMPVSTIGFSLKPVGFFDRNPGLDVPPPMQHSNGVCHDGANGH